MTHLPEGYEQLKTTSQYLSFSKLSEGEHKFRIVQRPIAGWVDWKENKPYRYRPNERPEKSFDPQKPMRAFWAVYVWDYQQEGLYVVEITQASILKALAQLGEDQDWGDFTKYDIKIYKKGSGKETKYHVSPVPHKPLSAQIEDALKEAPVHLEALYDGGDPWDTQSPSLEGSKYGITQKEADYLEDLLKDDAPLREHILKFLQDQGFGTRLLDMPSALYEKVVDRALKAQHERAEAENRAHQASEAYVQKDDKIVELPF